MTEVRVRVAGRKVIRLELEEYLRGVVPREMPALWEMEALKAQAVCARSYAAVATQRPRHRGDGADLCATTCCQVWGRATHPRTDEAIEATRGLVLWYQGPAPGSTARRVAQTFYSSRCGGLTGTRDEKTGLWKPVWVPAAAPWCTVVRCPCPELPSRTGSVARRGHGIGLCQWGARGRARAGQTAEEILAAYYPGAMVADLSE